MVLTPFDYVDTTCSEQFSKEAVYYKIKRWEIDWKNRALIGLLVIYVQLDKIHKMRKIIYANIMNNRWKCRNKEIVNLVVECLSFTEYTMYA